MSLRGQFARSSGISLFTTGAVWTVWTVGVDRPSLPPGIMWVAIMLLGLAVLVSRPSRRG